MTPRTLDITDEGSVGAATLAGTVVCTCLALLGRKDEWSSERLRITFVAPRIEVYFRGELVGNFEIGFGLQHPVLLATKTGHSGAFAVAALRDATFNLVTFHAGAWVMDLLNYCSTVELNAAVNRIKRSLH